MAGFVFLGESENLGTVVIRSLLDHLALRDLHLDRGLSRNDRPVRRALAVGYSPSPYRESAPVVWSAGLSAQLSLARPDCVRLCTQCCGKPYLLL